MIRANKVQRMGLIDQGRVFADRQEAGIEVGKMLERKYKNRNVLILGIPSGGVAVAYEIAGLLHGDLSVIITKKLPYPLNEELAIGAAAEDGSVYLTSYARSINEELVRAILKNQLREIQSRVQRFRGGKSLPDMKNRIVIIVDDGIATGSTIIPAIKLCKRRHAAMVIVAAPVCGHDRIAAIDSLADEVVVPEQPEIFFAVEQAYDDFHQFSDEEVTRLLTDFERKHRQKTFFGPMGRGRREEPGRR
jgi:putative phosphoribosyl transferase